MLLLLDEDLLLYNYMPISVCIHSIKSHAYIFIHLPSFALNYTTTNYQSIASYLSQILSQNARISSEKLPDLCCQFPSRDHPYMTSSFRGREEGRKKKILDNIQGLTGMTGIGRGPKIENFG